MAAKNVAQSKGKQRRSESQPKLNKFELVTDIQLESYRKEVVDDQNAKRLSRKKFKGDKKRKKSKHHGAKL